VALTIQKGSLPQNGHNPINHHQRHCRRPHMTNNDFPPVAPEKLPVIIPFPEKNVGNVKSVS